MVRPFRASRLWQVLAAVVGLGIVTGAFALGGLLSAAAQVTAYATVLLAFGTVGLAAGAIGTYVEQRRANQQQTGQLERRNVADIAQVQVERLSGAGELARIAVRNGSERAIRNVYVWVEVRGMTGHYDVGVQNDNGSVARGMSNVPHDGELYWQLRTLRPGQQEIFRQLTHMIKQPVAATAEANITAFAEFTDADGQWWRCDEDGEVNKRQPREVSQGPGRLMLETGLGRIPGLARPASDTAEMPAQPGPRWASRLRWRGRSADATARHARAGSDSPPR